MQAYESSDTTHFPSCKHGLLVHGVTEIKTALSHIKLQYVRFCMLDRTGSERSISCPGPDNDIMPSRKLTSDISPRRDYIEMHVCFACKTDISICNLRILFLHTVVISITIFRFYIHLFHYVDSPFTCIKSSANEPLKTIIEMKTLKANVNMFPT